MNILPTDNTEPKRKPGRPPKPDRQTMTIKIDKELATLLRANPTKISDTIDAALRRYFRLKAHDKKN